MSSAQILRSIQVRSNEQYTYDRGYNRMSFTVEPDGLSTDLSQSYLKFTINLTNIGTTGNETPPVLLTQADFDAYIANNLVVSFGHQGTAYPPSCMIYLCRLRAKDTGQILEEVLFSNVLTSTLFQLCNNFETLGANTLMSGTAMQTSGHSSDLMSALSTFTQPNTEIQINLRDIFGLCRHTNFDLSKTGGLIIELELEQTKHLFQTTVGYTPRRIDDEDHIWSFPEMYGTDLQYSQTPESNAQSFLAPLSTIPHQANKRPFFTDVMTQDEINAGFYVNTPKDGFSFSGQLFRPVQPLFVSDSNMYQFFFLSEANGGRDIGANQLFDLQIAVNNYAKLTFIMTDTVSKTSKPFVTLQQISAVFGTGGAGPGGLAGFSIARSLWFNAAQWTNYSCTLDQVEMLQVPNPENDPAITICDILPLPGTAGQPSLPLDVIQNGYSVNLTEAQITQMINMGLIYDPPAGDESHQFIATDALFDMSTQAVNDASGVILTYDRITSDGTNGRKIYSNQMVKLSDTGVRTYIQHIAPTDASGNTLINFGNIDLNALSGIQQGYGIIPAAASNPDMNTYTLNYEVAAPHYLIYITNVQQPPTPILQAVLSYSISQAQLILCQETMSIPMTPSYSSWSVEVASIESDSSMYSRQWIITAPNTYMGLFMLPDYLGSGSLIASARGLANYRMACNNISTTNRVITVQDVTSSSPSSLHMDKMLTAFQNSEYILRNFTGMNNVSDTHTPVVVLPMNIYTGVVQGQYQLAPQTQGATVQLDLYGGPKTVDGFVYKGPLFFFKQCIRNIDVGMGAV